MKTEEAIKIAAEHLGSLGGHRFNLLELSKPDSISAAMNLAKIVSKLSPMLGNLIEFNVVEFLNDVKEFNEFGKWVRQDPGFPDTIFRGKIEPAPGFEIKAWFPLATEITARFKDSQNAFKSNQTYVAMLAWLPEKLFFGKPYILDVCVVSGLSVAIARDEHYHDPPDYLVLEPEDTSKRTSNLRQTNTNGYKWQGTDEQFMEAKRLVDSWGPEGRRYKPTREYQQLVRQLRDRFPYRPDTNYAKMDRIEQGEIETFKKKVLAHPIFGRSIDDWSKLLFSEDDAQIRAELERRFGIKDQDTRDILR